MVEICGHRERCEERSREGGSPPELNHPGIGAAGIEGAPGTEGTDGAPGAEGIDDAPATDGTPIGEAVAVGDDIMEEHIFCIIWPAAFWPVCFAALRCASLRFLSMGEEFGVDCPAQTHCMVEICGHRKQRATPYDILRAPQ